MSIAYRDDATTPHRDPAVVAMSRRRVVFVCDAQREEDRIREFVARSMARFWSEQDARRGWSAGSRRALGVK